MGRTRSLAALAKDIDASGNITSDGIASGVSLGGGLETYDSLGLLPIGGLTNGDQAFVGNRLYISNGSGWYNVGLVNLDPSIDSGPNGAEYTLDSNGGTATSITISASDSDGTPIIWTYSTSDSAYELATITNDSNGTFTVAAKSLADILTAGYDSNGGSFAITFKASDGISFDTDSANFSITYYVSVSSGGLDWSSPTRTSLFPTTSMAGFDGNEQFGYSISFTPDGGQMAVGAPHWSNSIGSIQYFDIDSDGSTTYNTYTNGTTNYNHGMALAILSDTKIAIGGPGRSGGGYVSIRSTSNDWQSVSALTNIFTENSQTRLGQGMTWDPTSNVLAVWGTDGHIGKIEFMYSTNFTTWTRELGYTTLNTSYTTTGTMTTTSDRGVSLDKGRAAIGLRNYDFTGANGSGTSITNCGGVDLVDRSGSTGATYSQNATFISSPNPQESGRFGHDVQLLDDILIVSQYNDSANGFTAQGSVYCYSTDDSGSTWTMNQRIRELGNLDSAGPRYFGSNLDLTKTADGSEYLLAISSDNEGNGAAYVYGSTDKTTWTRKVRLEPTNDDLNYGEAGLKWNNDGTMLAIGQRTADSAGSNYGKVEIWTI